MDSFAINVPYIQDLTPAGGDKKNEPVSKSVQAKIEGFKICPKCGKQTLKIENGCETCINEKCLYSVCDY